MNDTFDGQSVKDFSQGNLLDEASGVRRKPEPVLSSSADISKPVIRTSWNKQLHETVLPSSSCELDGAPVNPPKRRNGTPNEEQKRHLTAGSRNIPKPQMKFQDLIDNSNTPFRIKLQTKHNALEKWKGNLQLMVDGEEMVESETDIAEAVHPYYNELQRFQPSEELLQRCITPQEPRSLEETEFIFISTSDELGLLCEILKQETMFAVDLEVFHGADKDIEWLQRDFGIYVVNMFDTGQAMRLLNFPRFSLAFLTEHYLRKSPDKQYQLADWRIRPFPPELIKYAREDSHYLLYCYERLKNQLLDMGNEEKNLLKAAFMRSRDICLNHYQKPLFNPEGYLELETRSRKTLNPRQKWALKELFAWRDSTARQKDESLKYVLPDHMLLQIADVLPREMQGILACCNPVPPLVRQELHELHRIIIQARDRPLTSKPEIGNESCVVVESPAIVKRRALNPLIHSPHDYSHAHEDEDIVPLSERLKGIGVDDLDWISPYEQYLLAKKMSEERLYELRNRRKRGEIAEADGQPQAKKMYSHRDKVERIPPEVLQNAGDELEFAEPAAKKKKKGTMAALEEALSKEIEKAAKKVDAVKKKAAEVLPFDYSKTDKKMFNAKKSKIGKDIFDPEKKLTRAEKKNLNKKQKGKKGGSSKKRNSKEGGLASKTLSYAFGGGNKKK